MSRKRKLSILAVLVLGVIGEFFILRPLFAERPAPPPHPPGNVIVSEGSCAWMGLLNLTVGLPAGATTTTQLVYGSDPTNPSCVETIWMPLLQDWDNWAYSGDYPSADGGDD